jgi:hypothetical protein
MYNLAENHPNDSNEVAYVHDHQKQFENIQAIPHIEHKVNVVLVQVQVQQQ